MCDALYTVDNQALTAFNPAIQFEHEPLRRIVRELAAVASYPSSAEGTIEDAFKSERSIRRNTVCSPDSSH